jgi:hypothetical protein
MRTSIAFLLSVSFGLCGTIALAKSHSAIHREICKDAAADYPNVFKNAAACVADTDLELTSAGYDVSFVSCESSEFVTYSYEEKTGGIFGGSSGYDCE